ncbi:MAG: efflux RND transporter permease subunit [Chloroflexi bacterium]|nr:efflux RND transporter permease subunit [Chloroflexota bacterium]
MEILRQIANAFGKRGIPEGMEGRVFAPLTVAFITALTASLLVSLTVTPALCSLLLVGKGGRAAGPIGDGWLVRRLKRIAEPTVRWSLHHSRVVMGLSAVLVVGAGALFPLMGREFLPRFNEGSYTINTILPPGTSLEESNRLGTAAERALMTIPEVSHVGRRTGRAELDEHAEGVNVSEIILSLDPGSPRSRGSGSGSPHLYSRRQPVPGITPSSAQGVRLCRSPQLSPGRRPVHPLNSPPLVFAHDCCAIFRATGAALGHATQQRYQVTGVGTCRFVVVPSPSWP